MKKTLTMVKAIDHFSTNDDRVKQCYLYRSGELIGEDEDYLRIRSAYTKFHPHLEDGEAEWKLDIYSILKRCIQERKDITIEWDGEDTE